MRTFRLILLLCGVLTLAGAAGATTTATAALTESNNQANVSLMGFWPPWIGHGEISNSITGGEIRENFTGNTLQMRISQTASAAQMQTAPYTNASWKMYIDGTLTTPANVTDGLNRGFPLVTIWTGAEGNHTLRIVVIGQVELGEATDSLKVTSSGTAALSLGGFSGYSVANVGSSTKRFAVHGRQ